MRIATAESGVIDSTALEPLPLVLLGFLFVIFVLSLLSALTGIMGFLFARRAAIAAEEQASSKTSAASVEPVSPEREAEASAEEDPVIQAVIAAAVHSVIVYGRGRVVSVRPASSGGWAQEGRRQIFSSRLGRS